MHDLLCPSKKLRFKVSSKPLVDFETISAIRKREESLKKNKKHDLKTSDLHNTQITTDKSNYQIP